MENGFNVIRNEAQLFLALERVEFNESLILLVDCTIPLLEALSQALQEQGYTQRSIISMPLNPRRTRLKRELMILSMTRTKDLV